MKIREICLYGILGALTFVLKVIMAPLPNIEPVSLLIMVYAIVFGCKAMYPLCLYVTLEIITYGIGIWSVGYLYIWLILAITTIYMYRLTNSTNIILWSCISGLYGLFVGVLYVPLYIISGGIASAWSWWVSGIPYDIIHCVANFVLCVVLFKPLLTIFTKLKTIQN